MSYRELLDRLDHRFPACGPCAICGGPDKRHRLWDAIECSARLDGWKFASEDYDVSRSDIRLLRQAYDAARRGHRKRPGQFPERVA